MNITPVVTSFFLLGLACAAFPDNAGKQAAPPRKFTRLFVWGSITNEATARAAKEIGVTDISVNPRKPEQVALAHKYGFNTYAGFGPNGDHPQKMTPEETALQDRLNGRDILIPTNATRAEKMALQEKRHEFRNQSKTSWGGEPSPDAVQGDVLMQSIMCFAGDSAYEKSRAVLKSLCETGGIDGISFDYIGYANFKGCYCDTCLELYRRYLADNDVPDNENSKNAFYLKQLVDYCNAMTDYIKSLRPDFKIMAHLYPVFLPEPLYGNRLKVDYCGQTAAWYILWPPDKIRAYSKIIAGEQNRYFPNVRGVPFIGYYDSSKLPQFPYKSAERVELELNAILDGGADSLMLCSGNDVLANPEIAAIFRKYCSRLP